MLLADKEIQECFFMSLMIVIHRKEKKKKSSLIGKVDSHLT